MRPSTGRVCRLRRSRRDRRPQRLGLVGRDQRAEDDPVLRLVGVEARERFELEHGLVGRASRATLEHDDGRGLAVALAELANCLGELTFLKAQLRLFELALVAGADEQSLLLL